MAEFTRDIKQLQQTAAKQPSFAPPSQSPGGDIVNLKTKRKVNLMLSLKLVKRQSTLLTSTPWHTGILD